MADAMLRSHCPICHKATRLPDAITRQFYRNGSLIHHLEGKPEGIGWVIDPKVSRAQRALFRKWAGVCHDCRNDFIQTRSGVLFEALDALLHTFLHDGVRSVQSTIAGRCCRRGPTRRRAHPR
jgi:hypothetical protein